MDADGTVVVHGPRETRTIVLTPNDTRRDLAELLRRHGLPLNTRCAKRGLCNGCLIEVVEGSVDPIDSRVMTSAQGGAANVRACQVRPAAGGKLEIRIPARSLLAHDPQIVESFRFNVSHAFEPLWQDVADPQSAEVRIDTDIEGLCRWIEQRWTKTLPIRPGEAIRTGGVAMCADVALAIEYRGDYWSLEPARRAGARTPLGIAVDIGTTTVVALLVDLSNGRVVGTASALNAQIALGDNVLTRINLCIQDSNNLGELQRAVIRRTMHPLIAQLLAEAQAEPNHIVAVCVAGNSTMLHLFCGIDPSPMGMAPFTPWFLEYRHETLRDLGSGSEPGRADLPEVEVDAVVHLLPGAAAYVGADITAGVFSSGMVYRREPCLLVDIGTNGEIVLNHAGRFVGCATAAGPAFEGAGMHNGVRAGRGAVSHVRIESNPWKTNIEVIGGGTPIGVCGTGYVDFVAQARLRGLIGATGRVTEEGRQSGLLENVPKGRAFRIATGRGGEAIVVSESDIASLLQAKAAIAAGIVCLLNRFGLTGRQIETVYLAGGFGFHMDLESLIGCGILPGLETSQIQVVGNTSLAGAYLGLMDAGAVEEIKRIAATMEIVELNLEPNFTSCYIDQLFLP